MKKLLMLGFVLLVGVCLAGNAAAMQFTLDGYKVDLRDHDPGLVLYWEPILALPGGGNYEVGDTDSFALFKVGTKEGTVNWNEDTKSYPISVSFDFSSPDVEGKVSGESYGQWRLLRDDKGFVKWGDPAQFAFGGTGLFSIALSDVYFGTPGCAEVWAKFTYEAAPVPEPATMLLLGSGLVGLAGYGRKKFKK